MAHDLAELERITHRGMVPSLPRQARVSLDLLPATLSERAGWERSVGRWGRACGCESSSLAFLSVIGLLVIARVGFGVELAPGGLPAPVWWVMAGLFAAVVTKLAVVLIARRALLRLNACITLAAAESKAAG